MATLEELRTNLGLSREDMAERCGVDAATIWRWERGVRVPRPPHVQKLAQVLGITQSEVMQAFYSDKSKSNKERVA